MGEITTKETGIGEQIIAAVGSAIVEAIPKWLPDALERVSKEAFRAGCEAGRQMTETQLDERVSDMIAEVLRDQEVLTSNDLDVEDLVTKGDIEDLDKFVHQDDFDSDLDTKMDERGIVTTDAIQDPEGHPGVAEAISECLARSRVVQAVIVQTVEVVLRKYGLVPAEVVPLVTGEGSSPADAVAARADREADERL